MAALAVQQFVSAAVGIAVAIALIRGFTGRSSATIGNFWTDLVRGVLYILLPVAAVATVIFVGEGALQTLAGSVTIHDTLNNVTQTIPRGPVASMEAIKQLGTNGGGYFSGNGATPFENPTPLTNLLSVYLILSIPVALTYTFGKMVGNVRQGVALLGVMAFFFVSWTAITIAAEHGSNPALAAAGFHASQSVGNMVGKESRFGVSSSSLYNVSST
ncbi:Potassium-transporting ATPase A subunit [Ferrithrix thermotolerans DSM 19514]|uniref:Potassium-transporting ATPase A subunit n=1 Tax=Ferrithrix thermotolerans DSM 19514 TaxID=1121881 RepID=A0A1M4WYD7_9ACTN|nr:Potassium-transporting ATPase A subunit [Ferrithrix thermotolerans DSM 19514]